jgi:NRPS condensation-like uncharacterized protein
MDTQWSRLDNAGLIYPAIVSPRNSTLFRFSMEMKESVDPLILRKALDLIMVRYPFFHVKIKRGFFWFYFKKIEKQIPLHEDLYYPCSRYDFKKEGIPLAVYWGEKRIALEMSHCLADGMGAMELLKSLLWAYADLKGVKTADTSSIKVPGEKIDPREYADGFKQIYDDNIPTRHKKNIRAFHLNGKLLPQGEYRVTTGSVEFSQIKKLAREKGQGITGLICTLYIDIFQQILYQDRVKPAPIVINLPVNLRTLFNMKTLHNFFIPLTPSVDPRVGVFSEDDLARHVKSFLNVEIDRRYVSQIIKRNILTERNPFLRSLPLALKEWVILPMIFRLWGERGYTSGISNMGKITFPPEIEGLIENICVIPPPSPGNQVKMTCYSFGNRFYMTFGSLSQNRRVEKIFFNRLIKHGIPVKINTYSR